MEELNKQLQDSMKELKQAQDEGSLLEKVGLLNIKHFTKLRPCPKTVLLPKHTIVFQHVLFKGDKPFNIPSILLNCDCRKMMTTLLKI
jgi:hypothetical protein